MTDPNHDDRRTLRMQTEQDRLARLRALGREMRLWHRFDTRLENLRLESAAKEQHYLDKEQHYLAKEQHYLRELENAKLRHEDLAAELKDTRRIAADRERELQGYLENSRLQFQQVVNSRSWKITQPLRSASRWIGKEPNAAGRQPEKSNAAESPQAGVPPIAAPPEASSQETSSTEPQQSSVEATTSCPSVPALDEAAPSIQATDLQPETEPVPPEPASFFTGGKDAWDETGVRRLQDFLASDRRLCFPAPAQPEVSIIIVLYNKAHLGFLCFESLLQNAGENYELVLIDNGSTDETSRVLDRIDGAKIIRNPENTGFGRACVQGAERAAGEYLCFLNNDVVLCPGALAAAIADFRRDASVGAVGGKLLLSDGRMQEAGSIVWRDGTAWGYGRGDDACSPKYSFRRPVDYCSGALLVTPRALFAELGCFDDRFSPAYYEDTDYCFKVWDKGRKVLYEPQAVVHHYESASMQSSETAGKLIADHQAKFVEKWKGRLQNQLPLAGAAIPCARIAVPAGGARIIYMGARVPHRELGADSSAANDFVTRLASEGHHVTCVSMTEPLRTEEYTDLPREIELADATSDPHYVFRDLLSQYDAVWIAGGSSMREFLGHMWDMAERVPPVIYEPGEVPADGDEAAKDLFDEELTLCQGADIVLVRSEEARQRLLPYLTARIELRSEHAIGEILSEISDRSRPREQGA